MDKLEEWKKLKAERDKLTLLDVIEFAKFHSLKILCFSICAIFIAGRLGVFGWGSLPEQLLQPADGSLQQDPCLAKERCIVAYVAPWCPSCKSASGFLAALQRRIESSSKVGMKTVIGMDALENLKKMAESFPQGVYFDADGSFASEVGVRSVPTVILADGNGKILQKGLSAAIYGNDSLDADVSYYISNYLKITE